MHTSRIETVLFVRDAQPRRGGLLAAGGLALAGLAFLVLVLGMPNGFPGGIAYGGEVTAKQLAEANRKLAEIPEHAGLKAPSREAVRALAGAMVEEVAMRQRIRDCVAATYDMPTATSTRARHLRLLGLLLLNSDNAADRRELAFGFLVGCHNLTEGPINPASAIMARFGALDPEASSEAALNRYLIVAEKYGVRANP